MEKQNNNPSGCNHWMPLGVLTCSLLWAVLLYLSLWRHCFRILFSGDSRADGTCGMERVGTSRHDLPIVPLYCGYLVSVLTEKQRGKGMTEGAIYKKIVRRGLPWFSWDWYITGYCRSNLTTCVVRACWRVSGWDGCSQPCCLSVSVGKCVRDNGSYFGWLLAGDGFCACAGCRWSGAVHARGKLGRVY